VVNLALFLTRNWRYGNFHYLFAAAY